MHSFEDVFWGPTADPLLGIKKLHENYQNGFSELEEILNFISIRMQTEEYYANRLQEMAAVRIRPRGELPKDNSVLSQVLVTLRQEATIISSTHRHMHDTLNRTYTSLKRFLDDHRRLSQSRVDVIVTGTKRYETLAEDAKLRRKEAAAKWDIARKADVEHKKEILTSQAVGMDSLDVVLSFGGLEFTVVEFNNLVSDIERDVPKQDVKSIIGTYKSVVLGASVLNYLSATGAKVRSSLQSHEGAVEFLNALISQGFLKSIAIRNSNKLPIADQQYQWKKTSLDNEPAHTKTRRDAERAELDYKNAVKIAEESRVVLEAHCVEHMKTVQIALLERLTLAHTVISSYIDSEQSCVSPISQSVDRFSALLETFSPEQQVQVMAEKDRSGNARLKPIVYSPSSTKIRVESKYLKSVMFGVSVDTLAARDARKVPNLLRKCLRALTKGCSDSVEIGGRSGELAVWLESNMYAPTVQSLRSEMNGSGKPISLARLRECPTSDIVGLVKLWLLQLPGALCGEEIYEPLKLLYLSKSDEFAGMRAGSIKSLLTTLSPADYNALYAVVNHWQKLLEQTGVSTTDSRVAELSQGMGPLILRPKVETLVTAFDKHPERFLRDLISHPVADLFQIALPSADSNHSLVIEGEDLDAEFDDDEEPLVEENDRIILLDAPDKRGSTMSTASSVAPVESTVQTDAAAAMVKDILKNPLEATRLSVAQKSDEDLFLEEEGAGLDDLNEEEMRKLEKEMDDMLM
ncbi:hypothetical protein HDU98_006929 [Podochytrium sp. JEL0797]|nr:hypothetical protein HDU98_006929 [Podochytrium sp. JEL0797]